MKMRKILSFVLVLSLVLGSFSMAFAATPSTGLSDIAGIANEEAIQVNNDLGIIKGFPDGTFLPEKAVTRAEFAAMITRALAVPESALAGYTSTTFKDTAGYGWAVPYLAFAQSKGIMIGDGMGNAMPGRTINVNEAMTMVLRAIGYVNHSSVLVGSWPANYVTVAQNVGLYDDVASAVTVDRANAAQIIYNALTVQKVSVNADGATTFLTLSGTSTPAVLLNTGLGCTLQPAAVITGEENSIINLKPFVGDYAIKVTKDSNGKVVTIKEVKSTALVGKFENNLDAADSLTEGGIFTTDSDDKEYKRINLATIVEGLYFANGDSVNAFDIDNTDTVTLNVKLDGTTIKEVYSVEMWAVNTAAKISDGQVKALAADDTLLGKEFILDDNDEIDLTSFELVGVKSLNDIKEDNVVYVYTNTQSGSEKVAKVAVGTEVITGKVTRVNADGVYTIDGKNYELTSATTIGKDVAAVAVGNEVKAWLDAYGDIYKAEKTGGTADKYAVVQFYAEAGINDAQVKMYTSDDVSKTFNIDDDYSTLTKAGFDAAGTDLSTATGYAIGYGLNKDGKIETVSLRTTTSAVATLSGVKVITVANGTMAISSDVVVFTDGGTDGYALSDINKIKTGSNIGTVKLTVNNDGVVVAMVVLKNAATKSADETYGVLNSAFEVYNATLDKNVNEFIGFAASATLNKLGSGTFATVNSSNGVVAPILYKVETDSDGFVKVTDFNSKLDVRTSTGAVTISAINGTYAVKISTNEWVQIASDAIVYEMKTKNSGADFDKYTLSTVDSLLAGYTIYLYDTNTDSGHEGFDFVVFKR